MVSHPKKVNPHCVVPGCRTKRPHSESPATQEVMQFFSDSAKLTMAVKLSIGDLIQSVEDDLEKGRFFAYHTRARQVEYCSTVSCTFCSSQTSAPFPTSCLATRRTALRKCGGPSTKPFLTAGAHSTH